VSRRWRIGAVACAAPWLLAACRPPGPAASPVASETPPAAAAVTPSAPTGEEATATRAAAPPAAAAEKPRNTLRWSTASELDNFGYDVYRGTDPEGPFERITRDPILGAGTTDEVSKYEFVDEAIDPYTSYYYYVESISLAGVRERFTPVVKKAAKLSPPDGSIEPPPGATPQPD
jgi:hypothetical protein